MYKRIQGGVAGSGAFHSLNPWYNIRQVRTYSGTVGHYCDLIVLAKVLAGSSPQHAWHWYACFPFIV